MIRAGMLISSRRSRVMVARPRPLPRSIPVSSWVQAEIAQVRRGLGCAAGSPSGWVRLRNEIPASSVLNGGCGRGGVLLCPASGCGRWMGPGEPGVAGCNLMMMLRSARVERP